MLFRADTHRVAFKLGNFLVSRAHNIVTQKKTRDIFSSPINKMGLLKEKHKTVLEKKKLLSAVCCLSIDIKNR